MFPHPTSATSLAPRTTQRAVVDRFGRRLRYVRISVTDLCNLSCSYCNPVKGCASSHAYKLSWEDLHFLADICVRDLGVEALRITGGEPLIRPGIVEWIAGLSELGGLRDIALTTNGIRLAPLASDLASAGLTRVNVSLDSFDPKRYEALTRGGSLERCLAGIHAARENFRRVKLNCVILRGVTEQELDRFVSFSHEHDVEVRFIELMPIFGEKRYFEENFMEVAELQGHLEALGHRLVPEGDGAAAGNRTGYGPATTYRVEGSRARLGFISQMSNTKCLSCNKLRLTSDGALKPCLLSPNEQDLAPAIAARDRDQIAQAMRRQFLERAERYDFAEALSDPFRRGMQAIGG